MTAVAQQNQTVFDQRHLIELYRRGLISELPYELGPMPIVDCGQSVYDDLLNWGVIDRVTGNLTPPAQELFAGVTNYEWAAWGIVLLYNERQPVEMELPSEFVRWKVHAAIRDIPRVTFMVGALDDMITTVTLAGGRMILAAEPQRKDINEHVAENIMAILDPQHCWRPYPMTEFALPAGLAQSLAQERAVDEDSIHNTVCNANESVLQAGLSSATANELAKLLRQQNVANAQICVTRRSAIGKSTVKNNASGVLFFNGDTSGVVVSYPRRALDNRQWISYEPGTAATLTRAIKSMRNELA